MKIDTSILNRFLQAAGDTLRGDWVILGGAVLQLLNIDIRVTTDIDIAAPETATQKDTVALMDIAVQLGLPIEAINQAAGYFLTKIKDWQKSLVLVHEGKNCRIYRPNADLFLRLKLARLSEADLTDCLALIKYAAKSGESLNRKRLRSIIDHQMMTEQNQNRRTRLMTLKQTLEDQPRPNR